MTLVLGTFIVALVLFMVVAMALAEWADKDPGDLWKALVRRRRPSSVPSKASEAVSAPAEASASIVAAPRTTPKSSRAARSRNVAPSTTKSSQGKRKSK